MKTHVKNILSRLLQFIICNLAAFLVGFLAMLIVALIAFDEARTNRFWTDLVFDIGMTLGFAIPFYLWYFTKNKAYQRLYLNNHEEGHDVKAIMRMHVRAFAKYDLPVIFVISLILSLFRGETLGRSGISFLFISASFFVDFIPVYLFESTAFVFRLIGFVMWDLYIAVLYVACLRLSYRKWERERLRAIK